MISAFSCVHHKMSVGAVVAVLTELNPHKHRIKKLMVTLLTILVVNKLWIYRAVDHVYAHSITISFFSHVHHMSAVGGHGGGGRGSRGGGTD